MIGAIGFTILITLIALLAAAAMLGAKRLVRGPKKRGATPRVPKRSGQGRPLYLIADERKNPIKENKVARKLRKRNQARRAQNKED